MGLTESTVNFKIRELELLRFEITQEVEASHADKCQLLERDSQKYLSLYYKYRRETESIKAEEEQKNMDLKRAMQDLKRAHDEENQQWHLKLADLQLTMGKSDLKLDQPSDNERLRICQREKTEMELRTNCLLAEVDDLRAEKEKLRLDYEIDDRTQKRQLHDQLSDAMLYRSERDALKTKCESIEEELRVSNRIQDEYQTENVKLKREIDKNLSKLEENNHAYLYTIFKHRQDLADSKIANVKEKNDWQMQAGEYKQEIASLTTYLQPYIAL